MHLMMHSNIVTHQYLNDCMQWDKQGAVRGTFGAGFCSAGNVALSAAACSLLMARAAAVALAGAKAAACTA